MADIVIKGRHVEVPAQLRAHMEDKLAKVSKLAPKAMRVDVLRSFTLHSDGFGIEPEMTAKIFKRGYRVYEIPITYAGRGYEEGKKITWTAGLVALWVLLKYRFTE